jgi:hypothetical protein
MVRNFVNIIVLNYRRYELENGGFVAAAIDSTHPKCPEKEKGECVRMELFPSGWVLIPTVFQSLP